MGKRTSQRRREERREERGGGGLGPCVQLQIELTDVTVTMETRSEIAAMVWSSVRRPATTMAQVPEEKWKVQSCKARGGERKGKGRKRKGVTYFCCYETIIMAMQLSSCSRHEETACFSSRKSSNL